MQCLLLNDQTCPFKTSLDEGVLSFSRGFNTKIEDLQHFLSPSLAEELGSVPDRPINVNPGLKFCSTLLYLLSMHCLE